MEGLHRRTPKVTVEGGNRKGSRSRFTGNKKVFHNSGEVKKDCISNITHKKNRSKCFTRTCKINEILKVNVISLLLSPTRAKGEPCSTED